MIIGIVAAALASPPGYTDKQFVNDCQLSLGPADGAGNVPMHAECSWPEIPFEKADRLLTAWGDHDLYFSAVEESTVQSTTGAVSVVTQTHLASGISNRQVVLDMTIEDLGDGSKKFSWKKNAAAPTLAKGNVACETDDGYWLIKPEGTGIHATYHLVYDPGGMVPGFLVKWFQGSGLTAVTVDFRTYANAH